MMYEENANDFQLNEKDLEISTTRGSGNGGQARNKLETCVVVKDKKSGISVRCESERSQYQNKLLAIELLKAKLGKIEKERRVQKSKEHKISQIGNLNRGSDKKVKIYKEKLNLVIDVKSNKKKTLTDWQKGKI